MDKNNILNENIKLTNNAIKRVNAILTGEKKEGYFLRISVVGGGCSGMSYNLSFDNKEGEFDKIYEFNGVKVVCDVKSWFYVKGTEIDFSDDLWVIMTEKDAVKCEGWVADHVWYLPVSAHFDAIFMQNLSHCISKKIQ